MVALSRNIVAAVRLACGLAVLALDPPGAAVADGSDGTQSKELAPCIVGHRFEPGPVADAHYRQPTPAEFESRMRELRAISQRSVCSRDAPPVSPASADVVLGSRPLRRPNPHTLRSVK